MIRSLRPGEATPPGEPRRYPNSHGYIRLRWKLGRRQYVECYEHRVVDGYVTDAEHVHHKNRRRDDNRPENLEHVTAEQHHEHHASPRTEYVLRRYAEGATTVAIAEELGGDASAIWRLLRRRGVQTRPPWGYWPEPDREGVAFLHAAGVRPARMARTLGVGRVAVERVMDELGLPRFPMGSPTPAEAAAADEAIRAWERP